MSERTYYVLCADNCWFEGMTKEQIYEAIAEATGSTPTPVDDAFITKIKESNASANLTFWKGTQAQFNALGVTAPIFKVCVDANGKLYFIPSSSSDLIAHASRHASNGEDALSPADIGALSSAGGTVTGAIAMSSNKITGLGTPTADADAATKEYVDDNLNGSYYGVCSTATGTLAKEVTVDDHFQLETGVVVNIKFTRMQQITDTENITINVNNTGAIAVYQHDTDYWDIQANTIHTFIYTGSQWVCVSGMPNSYSPEFSRYTFATTAMSYGANRAYGTYTGTGSSGLQISCGFQPKFFILVPTESSGVYNNIPLIMYLPERGAFSPAETGSTLTDYSITSYYDGIAINNANYMNISGETYEYFAFK